MSRDKIARILTPEGEILKVLLRGSKTAPQIVESANIGRTAVYTNLKDLLIAGYVIRNGDTYRVSNAGVKAYLNEVLPGVDAGSLLGISSIVGTSPLKLVEAGIRILLAVAEAGYVPADLGRLLARYDSSVLEVLEGMFPSSNRPGKAGLSQAAEVVE